jgi:nicotinamidase-related amidase
MRMLIVVDMQNDFISGALGSAEARAIVEPVRKKIEAYRTAGFPIIFTRDTHGESYLDTQEGKRLPVPHCVRGTRGWEIADGLSAAGDPVVDKPSFGSTELPPLVRTYGALEGIELAGLCTDVCVLSNALILKAFFPETPVSVDAACCAGTSPEGHAVALRAMGACQVAVLNEGSRDA